MKLIDTTKSAVSNCLTRAGLPKAEWKNVRSPLIVSSIRTKSGWYLTDHGAIFVHWLSVQGSQLAVSTGLKKCVKALEAKGFSVTLDTVHEGDIEVARQICVLGRFNLTTFDPKDKWVAVNQTGRVGMNRQLVLNYYGKGKHAVAVQFGADGPMKIISPRSLRPATADEIARITGEKGGIA